MADNNLGAIYSMFGQAPKQDTVTNPNKDRRLAGKARVKARKAANKEG